MQKIVPFLWFQKEAKEAILLYCSLFADSKITQESTLSDTPSGSVRTFSFTVAGQEFSALEAQDQFTLNPSISLFVGCQTEEEVDTLWQALSKNGKVLMDLAEYPFAKKYGWVEDKYGISWQLMYMEHRPIVQKITPTMMFTGPVAGKAEEAITFYTGIFSNSRADILIRYEKGDSPVDQPGTLKHAIFTLENEKFGAMDSAHDHAFNFSEAFSFVITCEDQKEVDYFWEKLTANGGAPSQCGWLKDQYGVSWQVVPKQLHELLGSQDKEVAGKAMAAMLKMQKIVIDELK